MHRPDSSATAPVRIGVTGGIGSGKSTLVALLETRGAAVFDADRCVHELYERRDVIERVQAHFGVEVVTGDGRVDQHALARRVFGDPDELRWLEALVHPLVAARWETFVDEATAREPRPTMIVAEVPLLFEAGLEDRYDLVVAVAAPEDVRRSRVAARGHGDSHVEERSRQQWTDEQRIDRADIVVHNDGDRGALVRGADRVADAARSLRRG